MKVKFTVATNRVGSECSDVIDFEDELDGLSNSELESYLNEYLDDWMWNYVDSFWDIKED